MNGQGRRRVETSATASHNGRDTQPVNNLATFSEKIVRPSNFGQKKKPPEGGFSIQA
jgi:hypothetical protein